MEAGAETKRRRQLEGFGTEWVGVVSMRTAATFKWLAGGIGGPIDRCIELMGVVSVA